MKKLSRIRLVCAFVLATSTLMSARVCLADSDCQIALSQPEVDMHMLRTDEAIKKSQGWNMMQDKDINVTVSCPTPRKMAIYFNGSAGEKGHFKFGSQSGISIKASQLTVDGQQYAMAKTMHAGSFLPDGNAKDELLIHSRDGIIAVNGNTAVTGQQINFLLQVTPIMRDGEFKVSDRKTLSSDISIILVDE